jgi:transmembrane sensor
MNRNERSPGDPDEVALDDLAAEWLVERAEGFTAVRAAAFAAWRDSDPRHAAAVARVERTFALLDEMPAVRGTLQERYGAEIGSGAAAARVPRPRVAQVVAWGGLAAAVIIATTLWLQTSLLVPAGAHYAAANAAVRRVPLEDGSQMDLNRNSEAHVALSAAERRVTLAAGEAHFEVARDAARPFVVAAGGVQVRALGTAFTVRLSPEGVEVVVVEGKVEVASGSTGTRGALVPVLAAGERVRVARAEPELRPRVEKVAPEALRALFAWQEPLATFDDVPLRDVIERFNRRHARQLVLEDAALGERKIGGVIALDQLDAFVRLLAQDGDIVIEQRDAGAILLRRAR